MFLGSFGQFTLLSENGVLLGEKKKAKIDRNY